MPISDPIFLTTYQGPSINRDGTQYVWVNGRYEVSTNVSVGGTGAAYGVVKKVVLKFYGIVETNLSLPGTDLKVYIDGQLWSGNYIKTNANSVEVSLDEPFIKTQRLITFETSKGSPKVRYVIKSRVFSDNDIVISKIGIAEEIPVLGTANIAVVSNPPTFTYSGPTGTSGTSGVVSTPSIGVSINYEKETVQLGQSSDFSGNFFNQSNQKVDATIGEVVGPTYE